MKTLLKTFSLAGLLLISSKAVMAAPCDGSAAPGGVCERPGFPASNNLTPPTGWVFSTTRVQSIRALVSATATGNPANSRYYFAATNAQSAAIVPVGGITDSSDGTTEISPFLTNATATPTDAVNGGTISGLRGGTAFVFYAQACPSGVSVNDSRCSSWTRIRDNAIATSAYPATPFVQPPFVATDSEVAGLVVRTNLPAADPISTLSLTVYDMDNALSDAVSIPFSGGTNSYIVDNTEYAPGFRPNTRYRYEGQAVYEYGVVTPATPQNVQTFYTRPANPVPGAITNVTHCSARLSFLNAAGAPANPSTSQYQVCLDNGAGCLQTAIGGATPATSNFIDFTGLQSGIGYQGDVKVLNLGPSPWRPSETVPYSGNPDFTTLAWGGTFNYANVTTISADVTFTGLNTAGVTSWQMIINGSLVGSPTVGVPTSPIPLTGLTPNTRYDVRVRLFEASCNSDMPIVTFYTLPVAPTGGSLTAPGPRTLQAGWTDANVPAGNPNGSTYTVERCLTNFTGPGASCTSGSGTQSATKASTSPSATITTGIIPETQYFARVKTVSASGNTANDSAWHSLGNATTPNEAPSITNISHSLTTNQATLTPTITDNGPSNQLVCHWTVTASPGGAVTSFTQNDSLAACTSTVLNFNPSGAYTVQLVVRDHTDTGLTDTDTDSFSPGQTATTIDAITANAGQTIVVGTKKSFRTIVRDQFGIEMVGQGVSWALSNGAGSNTPIASSTHTTVTGVNSTLRPVTLTASFPGLTPQTISITVLASGPQFTVSPTIVLNSDGKTANLAADAIDNSPGAGTMLYTWSIESGPTTTATFSDNGTATAKNSVVTFTKAGTYVLRCTIQDNFASDSALTSAAVVAQRLSGLTVSPNNVTIKVLAEQVFSAAGADQFGDAMTPVGVQWSTTGGTVSGAGVFSSPGLGSNIRVTARIGNVTGAATVNLVNFDLSAAYAYPVPFKGNRDTSVRFDNLGSSAKIRIFTASGKEVFSIDLTQNNWDWNVKNSSGENVASGVYFYVIQSPEGKKDGKLIIVR